MKTDILEKSGTKVWKLQPGDFPAHAATAKKLQFLLQYAVLAPSSHNTQPWKFRIEDDHVGLLADRSRACPVVDPLDRELIMSCGAAFLNLRVAARHFGYHDIVEIFPDRTQPALLARFRLGEKTETYLHDAILFQSIPNRRTNRKPFSEKAVPEAVFAKLQEDAREEGTWLQCISDTSIRAAVVDLVMEGDRTQMANSHFRAELAHWLRPAHGSHHDGMPAPALGVSRILSTALVALALRTFDIGEGRAARDQEIIAHSPVLAVIGTRNDVSEEWFAAGQALEKIWLRASLESLSLSFLNQPIEVRDLRSKLAVLIKADGYPQLLLRIGYGPEVPATPRRSVHDVLE